MADTETLDLLARVPLLGTLDRKALKRLARDFGERVFPAGTVVVKQGDERGIGFFVIANGEASVSVDGKEAGRLGPGDHFGEIALLGDRVRTATVTAETELRCLVLTLWEFQSLIQSEPDVAVKLIEGAAALQGRPS
jgi:CRP-like cAMP-binding protein